MPTDHRIDSMLYGWGFDVMKSDLLPEGEILVGPRMMIEGIRRATEVEQAKREARKIVRDGMADVIEWLRGTPNDVSDEALARRAFESYHRPPPAIDLPASLFAGRDVDWGRYVRLHAEERIALEIRRPMPVEMVKIVGIA